MAEKRYYWIKLKDEFFTSKEIKKLRKLAGGDTYTIVYLKMMLLSKNKDGFLFWEGIEDSFEEEIALEMDENVDDVKMTVLYLKSKGLLEEVDREHYFLPETLENIGSETATAGRMRKSRANKRAAELESCNLVTPLLQACDTEKEKDIENIPPKAPQGAADSVDIWEPEIFARFWAKYPKKKDKKKAIREWNKLKPDRQLMWRMDEALDAQMVSEEWQRDDGRAIPYPCRWLSHRRWEDELSVDLPAPKTTERELDWL